MAEGNRAVVQFMENLKKLKKDTIPWAHAKIMREDEELTFMEAWINSKSEGDGLGFFLMETRKSL